MYQSIFVPVSSHGDQSGSIGFALALAQQFQAQVDVAFTSKSLTLISPEMLEMIAKTFPSGGEKLSLKERDALIQKLYLDQWRERAKAAQGHFESLVKNADSGTASRVRWGEPFELNADANTQFQHAIGLHDLVIASRNLGHTSFDSMLDSALFSTGRPVALIENYPLNRRWPESTVILAWKNTPETLRAQWFSLPLLRNARRVILCSIQEKKTAATDLAPVANYLAQHGISAHCIHSDTVENPAAFMQDLYRKHEADLLVMGAYSRPRFQERIFGGFTRHFLENRGVNLFMAH